MSNDWIHLRQLRIESASVGIHPHERKAPQAIILSVSLQIDLEPAAESGDIAQTIDYDLLSQELQKISQHKHYDLIETLAHDIAAHCLKQIRVEQVRILVEKPQALKNGLASVEIQRSRR